MATLLAIHASVAIVVVIVLVTYILLNLKGNFKHTSGMTPVRPVILLTPPGSIVAGE
ncbi:MAG: hypothetical protein V3R36_03610 [Dehalococcoidales bacterium]